MASKPLIMAFDISTVSGQVLVTLVVACLNVVVYFLIKGYEARQPFNELRKKGLVWKFSLCSCPGLRSTKYLTLCSQCLHGIPLLAIYYQFYPF